MTISPHENIGVRLSLFEKRLNLLSDEMSVSLARLYDGEGGFPVSVDVPNGVPSELSFDADSLSQFATGFYAREYDAGGVMFRWTGDGPLCELRFHVNRDQDRFFRLNVGEAPRDILETLTGHVDYAPISLSAEFEGANCILSGIIPRRATTRLAVLSFILGEVPRKEDS